MKRFFDFDENMKSLGCIFKAIVAIVIIFWGIIGLLYIIAFILGIMNY